MDPNAATVTAPGRRQALPPKGPKGVLTHGEESRDVVLMSIGDDGALTILADEGLPLDTAVRVRSKDADPDPVTSEGVVIWTRAEEGKVAIGVRLDGDGAGWKQLLD